MGADFALRSALPGSSQIPVSCRAWLESRSRVQHYPSTIRFLWVMAGIGDALREERYEEAYLRSLLGLAAGEQLSIDKGSWNVASEILLEDPPRFPAFTRTFAEVPFTKLIDASFIARLREVDLYLESLRKLAAGPGGGHRKREDGGAPQGRGENDSEASEGERKGSSPGRRGEVNSPFAGPSAVMELVRVSGSGAKTVDPAALWKALPRLLSATCRRQFLCIFLQQLF